MVEDYAYEGAYFQNDPELVLPEGEVWDDRGKKTLSTYVFWKFIFISFLFSVVLR